MSSESTEAFWGDWSFQRGASGYCRASAMKRSLSAALCLSPSSWSFPFCSLPTTPHRQRGFSFMWSSPFTTAFFLFHPSKMCVSLAPTSTRPLPSPFLVPTPLPLSYQCISEDVKPPPVPTSIGVPASIPPSATSLLLNRSFWEGPEWGWQIVWSRMLILGDRHHMSQSHNHRAPFNSLTPLLARQHSSTAKLLLYKQ